MLPEVLLDIPCCDLISITLKEDVLDKMLTGCNAHEFRFLQLHILLLTGGSSHHDIFVVSSDLCCCFRLSLSLLSSPQSRHPVTASSHGRVICLFWVSMRMPSAHQVGKLGTAQICASSACITQTHTLSRTNTSCLAALSCAP